MARPTSRHRSASEVGWTRNCWFLFAAALALRLAYVASIRDTYFFDHLQTDALRYLHWARLIVEGRAAPAPPFEQAPGYPYFVAAICRVFGPRVTAVAVVQALLGALTCVCIAVAGRGVGGRRAGLIAGVLAAAYGPFLYFTAEVLPSTLFLFLAAAACAAALFPQIAPTTDNERRGSWSLSGWLWAAAFAVRVEVLLAFPFIIADALLRGGRRSMMRAGVPVVLTVAALAILGLGYSHRLVPLTTSGGVNLWLGNNPHADGVSPFLSAPLRQVDRELRAEATDAVELDRLFARQALSFWWHQPRRASALVWKKFLWTWTDRELPNAADIEWKRAHSWLFARPFFPLSFGIVLPLALAGIVIVARQWKQQLLLLGLIAVGTGTAVIFFTNARFRLAMTPALLVFAAVTLDRLPSLRRARACGRATILCLAVAAGGLLLAWGNFYGVGSYKIPQITVNTGILEREAGNYKAAARHLRDGVQEDPGDVIGWIHLALALEQGGNLDAALQAYATAASTNPGDEQIAEMSRRFFKRHGISAAAMREYLQATEGTERGAILKAMRQRLRERGREGQENR
jgi:tetratricopeptide (TPR) repeat protein